ncbi:MAG: isocitrate lyase/phosphoenolpyruvate mutase family protein [Pyrinomonadaceae bacterium]
MSSQKEKAERFAALHISGEPVILFNVWDAGSAKAVADGGAKAIATGSWSVAAANGFYDAEALPLNLALENIARIVNAVDLPVTLDFEGGYATDIDTLKANIAKVIDTGAVGINFEDQVIGGEGMHSIEEQSARIAAIRETANTKGIPLFINARTDVFLQNEPSKHAENFDEAVTRAHAYTAAGASSIFAPGLKDPDLIRTLCERSTLPVNIMVMSDTPSNPEMSALGVARISYGPGPYRQIMEALKTAAHQTFGKN